MQYHEQIKPNSMEEAECSGDPLCSKTSFEPFSMRQYVLLCRQKDMFQNWPFSEKYLRLCLKYGVTNVLPPLLESRGSSMDIPYDKEKASNVVAYDLEASYAATISTICEQIQLMSLYSYNDYNQNKENNPSDMYYRNTNVACVNPSNKRLVRKRERSRRWKRKFKSMAEIYATAKHRILEEDDELNDLIIYSSEIIRDTEGEQMQKTDGVDWEYSGDSKSELTVDNCLNFCEY